MRKMDYHVHSTFSPDSKMLREDAVKAAIAMGITDLCFTEHMDLGHNMEKFSHVPDLEGMRQTVDTLREQYPEIQIGFGIEAGYIAETAAQTAEILSTQNFDYVLLSTHCVDGMDCYMPEAKRGRSKPEAYTRYLETLYESVTDSRLQDYYDCVSHIGYIAKCMYYEDNSLPYQFAPKLFDDILIKIIKEGKGIEVNTSGVKRAGHVLPHPTIIQRYRDLGGKIITFGSDAHAKERVGEDITEAMQIARECGFREMAVFRKRQAEFTKLDCWDM